MTKRIFTINVLCLGVIWLMSIGTLFAQRGKNGIFIVTASNTVVNEYTQLTSNAFSGSPFIAVTSSNLNTNNRFPNPLEAGDLLMIIQLQGVEISGSSVPDGNGNTFGLPKDSTWGTITNYNNCGNHEWAQVKSVVDPTTIELDCGLQNDYTASGKVLVIRVPRYESLVINAGASINCDIWNGNTGGIVAIEVNGDITNNGQITTSARGFRGGVIDNQSNLLGVGDVSHSNMQFGGEKGESVAGFQNDYNVVGGRYCKGAPANGGGGGNAHNAGGGGGGNGGNINQYFAVGNPSLATANWANAWNLELPGLANITSSGGGKGGYTASNSNQNALIVGPGAAAWGGDLRRAQGGYGGRPLDYSTGRIFMGGGGGAGDGNDGFTGAGGRAGGMIYLVNFGNITGSGSITADGANGGNAQGTGNPPFNGLTGQDGAGGGGAGGTIIIKTTGSISGVSASAIGGNGGNQVLQSGPFGPGITEAEGPGGGGSGGYINSSAPITANVNGGANGTTNSSGLTEFTPNGATAGGAGTVETTTTLPEIIAQDVTICQGGNATLSATVNPSGSFSGTLEWFMNPAGGTPIASGNTITVGPLANNTTFYVGACPGFYRVPVNVNVTPGVDPAQAGIDSTLCSGTINLYANQPSSGTGSWQLISGNATLQDAASPTSVIDFTQPGTVVLEWTISSPGCPSSSDQVSFTIVPSPDASQAGANDSICGTSVQLNANAPLNGTGLWTLISGSGIFTNAGNPQTNVNGLSPGENIFEWTIANGICPASSSQVIIHASPQPDAAIAGPDQTVCSASVTLSGNTPINGTPSWSIVSGSGTLNNPQSASTLLSSLTPGTTVVQYTISSGVCPPTTDVLSINVVGSLPPASAGTDMAMCSNQVNLSATLPSGLSGNWTIISGNGQISNPAQPDATLSASGNQSITLVWAISDGVCPANADTVTILFNTPPSIANAGPDITSCNAITSVTGNQPISGIPSWTLSSNDGTIVSVINNTAEVSGPPGSQVVLLYTISNGVCPSSSDQVTIQFSDYGFSANAGPDQQIIAGDSVQLGTAPQSGYTYSWTPANGLSCQQCPNPMASPSESITYQLILTDAYGCSFSDSLKVEVDRQLDWDLPNAFSPNGDNQNDIFRIRGNGIKSSTLIVYDRWGNKVFEADGLDNGWDGTYNAKICHPGVYVYYAEVVFLNGTIESRKGNVSMFR
jgi:gliding motility-associated-like protein